MNQQHKNPYETAGDYNFWNDPVFLAQSKGDEAHLELLVKRHIAHLSLQARFDFGGLKSGPELDSRLDWVARSDNAVDAYEAYQQSRSKEHDAPR